MKVWWTRTLRWNHVTNWLRKVAALLQLLPTLGGEPVALGISIVLGRPPLGLQHGRPAPIENRSAGARGPWLDQPPGAPDPNIAGSQLVWEELDSWLLPPEKFHYVAHYGVPTSGLDAGNWLVASPAWLPTRCH